MLRDRCGELPSTRMKAEVAAQRAGSLHETLQEREAELADGRHAIQALHVALEEVTRDTGSVEALYAAHEALRMREAEAASLRKELADTKGECVMLAAALSTVTSTSALNASRRSQ